MSRNFGERGPAAGFTLIEILVVLVIIGVVVAATLLSLGSREHDTQLEQERDRLAALIGYVRERAALQTLEYGLRCDQGGYRFVLYDTRAARWLEDPLDESLRARRLPPGIALSLRVEDRSIVLPAGPAAAEQAAPQDLTPQVMLYSSGDMSSFSLTLSRIGTGRSATLRGTPEGQLDVGAVTGQPP